MKKMSYSGTLENLQSIHYHRVLDAMNVWGIIIHLVHYFSFNALNEKKEMEK